MATNTTERQGALLNQREVCDRLGISKSTMQRLIAAGALEPVRIAGIRPRYRRSDVEALIRGEGSP